MLQLLALDYWAVFDRVVIRVTKKVAYCGAGEH